MALSLFFIATLEILIITMVLNYLLAFFWNTRAMDLFVGLLAFMAIFAVASSLHFQVVERLMLYVVDVSAIALLIIFQPEFRIALSKLSMKGRRYRAITELDTFLDAMSQVVYRLADKKIGALIILENQDSLEEFAKNSVQIHAEFSGELLETIFSTTTPLHDGAVLIRGTSIISAATILPLAEDTTQLTRAMGTRHRAGLGISQVTDALIIVVSEETGRVSIARDGIMTRGVKIDRFKGIIRSIFTAPTAQKRFKFLEWLTG